MAVGASFRIAPGVRIYQSGSGAVLSAIVMATLFVGLWFTAMLVMAFIVGLVLLGFLVAWAVGYSATKRRLSELQARAIDPSTIATPQGAGSPSAWGVYRVETYETGRRTSKYYVGNFPGRYKSLLRQFGRSDVVRVFMNRLDAEELKHLLATGRVSVSSVSRASAGHAQDLAAPQLTTDSKAQTVNSSETSSPSLKSCSICGRSFPLSEFAYGGRENRSYCQQCNRAEHEARAKGGNEAARAFREAMRSKWRSSSP